MNTGKLYIVATPIGNLGDITLRALETLRSVDFVLCEDTRVTKKLLDKYEIVKPTISYHHHSDGKKIKEIKDLLLDGKNLALVTDAGTPGISDPGNLLVQSIIHSSVMHNSQSVIPAKAGIQSPYDTDSRFHGNDNIIPIPGPSALTAALSICGFPTDKFVFFGFPPHKNKRQKFFKELATCEHTVVFYESGHRITKCLKELQEFLNPKQQIMIGRELTKQFETIYRGTINDISTMKMDERGEFVIVINK